MKFSELSKQQKEHLILAVMGVVTFIAIVQNLVLAPNKVKAAAARTTIDELASEVRNGESLLARDITNRRRLETLAGQILTQVEAEGPPEFSRYTWALGRISQVANPMGIFPQIREFSGQRFMPNRLEYAKARDKSGMWVPYTVEVEFRAGYGAAVAFLEALHREDPLASVGQLSISANPDDPERHLVKLLVEWPMFRYTEDREFLLSMKGAES